MSTQKPFHSHKHNENGECTNHLQKDFNQKAPNLVWVSDFTYIKADGKWYYFCIVMDLFSRKIISWNISGKPDVDLVMTAFKKAYKKRNAPLGLMFHSDRGTQYTAFAFRQLLDCLNVVQSFSKKGYPFDNACCECFFKYLKEEVNRKTYHCSNSGYLCSNTLKDSIMPRDHIVLSEWWHQMKKKNGTGHSSKQLYSALFLYKLCLLYWL